jgi:hypothetical protein
LPKNNRTKKILLTHTIIKILTNPKCQKNLQKFEIQNRHKEIIKIAELMIQYKNEREIYSENNCSAGNSSTIRILNQEDSFIYDENTLQDIRFKDPTHSIESLSQCSETRFHGLAIKTKDRHN